MDGISLVEPGNRLSPREREDLVRRATEAMVALYDPTHPEHEATRERLREIEARIREQSRPLLEAIVASERITCDDLRIVINAGLYD